MLVFANWDYYLNEFRGSKLSREAFDNIIGYCSSYVQTRTFGKAKTCLGGEDAALIKSIKSAVCAICEEYATLSKGKSVKSENIDGYSVTYADTGNAALYNSLDMILHAYLGDTGLLRRV